MGIWKVSRARRRTAATAMAVTAALAGPLAVVVTVPSAAATAPVYLDPGAPIERRVSDLLGRMTLQEKIGQMTQAERAAVADDPTQVAAQRLGSLLSGGGSVPADNTPAGWVKMINTFQAEALRTRLKIPLIYGVDAVHGHNNVYGATVFPHNVGLGATRDPRLAEKIGQATAAEVRATGVPWNFAPCLCVSLDERWGRSYESFGEDPALASNMSTVIDGLQGRGGRLDRDDRVLATAKHFAGDGGTAYDTAIAEANEGKPWWEQRYPIDQGVTVTGQSGFYRTHVAPYLPALKGHDVGSVMPSFSSVDWTEDGIGDPIKMHANHDLLTGVLKGRLGFDGFVISDWEGIHQIPDPAEPGNTGLTAHKVRTGVNAGIDMFMEPNSAPQFQELLLAEVEAGRVSRARVDDAVRRILTAKFRLGLFENPYAGLDDIDRVGSAGHRTLAREAVATSQVLLKNRGGTLPLGGKSSVYVAGRNADDIGNQAGGWTMTWQGESGDIIPGTTILEGIRQVAPKAKITYSEDASAPIKRSDVGVVVVGETPYAEGYGDVGGPECGWCSVPQQEEKSLTLQPADQATVDKVCAAVDRCVVLVVSGRPQIVADPHGRIDALVASWLPGSEGAGVADVLFGRRPFTGRLPVSWPATADQVPINIGDAHYRPLYPFGWGLRTHPRSGNAASRPLDNAESRALDKAQAAVVRGRAPANWAELIAGADHALLTGDRATALRLLARVGG
ncbi:beta-glucosidase [Thermomonospora echinospora]|uniref:beta-glucosidase n=1 Tax=Thermomonospora echinospora TaxID=1992 RepID=A0A1H6DKF4_9ACTN|nr:glycoside hydrolase family 3 protein [Thermomonospora echinospora]SEG85599.1 beta-glucosidase [Thermomonospora echinospora]